MPSLIYLGAYGLNLLPEDHLILVNELPKHFSEELNGKFKVLGICPAFTIKHLRTLASSTDMENRDAQAIAEQPALNYPIY